MASVSSIFNGAVQSAQSSVGTAASQLAQGDVAGAVSSLQNGVSTLFSNTSGVSYGDDFAGIQARGDAIQNWCWYAIMPNIINSNSIGLNSSALLNNPNLPTLQPSLTMPWYYVEEASVPHRTFGEKTVDRNGHQIKYPEGYSVGDLSLTFFMDDKNTAMEYLKAWQGLILGNNDPTKYVNQGRWGVPAIYKKDITLVVASVNKSVLLTYKFIGCWPKNLSDLSLASSTADRLKMPVTFSVDDMGVTVQNTNGLVNNILSTAQGFGLTALQGVSTSVVDQLTTAAGSLVT